MPATPDSPPGVPDNHTIQTELGTTSEAFRSLLPRLEGLFDQVRERPEVAASYQEWQYLAALVYGADLDFERLYLRHTYLALIARFIVRLFLAPGSESYSWSELGDVVLGDYFRERGIDNFVEDDFFTWLLKGPDIAEPAQALLQELAQTLGQYDFAQAQPNVLKGLYDELVDLPDREHISRSTTPDWLAGYLLGPELGLSDNPDRRVLDPFCGSGTFLYTALGLIGQARRQRGEDDFEILINLLDQVMGLDINPVAVTVGRVSYLLALGDLVKGSHPPLLVPVYLAAALALPESRGHHNSAVVESEPIYQISTSPGGPEFEIPCTVATNLEMLDWLFARLPNYLRGAKLRSLAQSKEVAIQEVLNAFHNYLVSPKPKTPIPEPLSFLAAEVMEATAHILLRLYLHGKGQIWLHLLKNLPASVYMSQRKFDLVVGSTPGISNPRLPASPNQPAMVDPAESRREVDAKSNSEVFFAAAADLYLEDNGEIGLTVPLDESLQDPIQRFATGIFVPDSSVNITFERIVDLTQVSRLYQMPAIALIGSRRAGSADPIPGVRLQGKAPSSDATWEIASAILTTSECMFVGENGILRSLDIP
ncbi:MAG: hypothetical protein ACE5Q6_05805 [Dehalococcoidia bacterium]